MDFKLGLKKLRNLQGKFKKQPNKDFTNKNKLFKFKIIKYTSNNKIREIVIYKIYKQQQRNKANKLSPKTALLSNMINTKYLRYNKKQNRSIKSNYKNSKSYKSINKTRLKKDINNLIKHKASNKNTQKTNS